MPDLFGVDIAKAVNDGLGKGLLAATLTVVTPGTRTSGGLTSGTQPTTVDHTARGFLDDYEDRHIDGTVIQRGDRICVLLGASISGGAIPSAGDRVTIESETFNIVNVKRDPAAASYTMQVRS